MGLRVERLYWRIYIRAQRWWHDIDLCFFAYVYCLCVMFLLIMFLQTGYLRVRPIAVRLEVFTSGKAKDGRLHLYGRDGPRVRQRIKWCKWSFSIYLQYDADRSRRSFVAFRRQKLDLINSSFSRSWAVLVLNERPHSFSRALHRSVNLAKCAPKIHKRTRRQCYDSPLPFRKRFRLDTNMS